VGGEGVRVKVGEVVAKSRGCVTSCEVVGLVGVLGRWRVKVGDVLVNVAVKVVAWGMGRG